MKNHHMEGLVFFSDLSRFGRLTKDASEEHQGELLTQFARITLETVTAGGGTVVKYISDSALGFFPEADSGVQALLEMKRRVETEMVIAGNPGRIRIAGHFGGFYVITYPPFDTPDVLGDAVNIAVRLGEGGQSEHNGKLIISAPTFRKLSKETRTAFHKFTPPIVYLAEG